MGTFETMLNSSKAGGDVSWDGIDSFLQRYIKPNPRGIFPAEAAFINTIIKKQPSSLFDVLRPYLKHSGVECWSGHSLEYGLYEPLPKKTARPTKEPSKENNYSKHVRSSDHETAQGSRKKLTLPSAVPHTSFGQKIRLPVDFLNCNVEDLINLISRMLNSLILVNDKNVYNPTGSDNDQLNPDSQQMNGSRNGRSVLTRYHSRTPPGISLYTYISRLTKFNNFTPATLLTSIYYIDLLSHHYQPFFTLNSWTVHRFLLVATMLAQKLMEDFFFTNDHYAKVGGVAIGELNCLELDFLTRVDWRCVPAKQLENGKSSIKHAKDVLDLYYQQLVRLMGRNISQNDTATYIFEDEAFEDQNERSSNGKGTIGFDSSKSSYSDHNVEASPLLADEDNSDSECDSDADIRIDTVSERDINMNPRISTGRSKTSRETKILALQSSI